MFKPSAKTVVLFVKHYIHSEQRVSRFVECTTVGAGKHYKTPQEFICDFQRMYSKINNTKNSDNTFTIENVVIE